MTRTPLSSSKSQRSRSPGRFAHRRVGAWGGCSGGRENVLAVGNCCYVAVCSAAEGASAPTGVGEGRGHTVAAACLQLVIVVVSTLRFTLHTHIFAETCTSSHPECESIWNTDVRELFNRLTIGTLNSSELHSFCGFLCPRYQLFTPSWLFTVYFHHHDEASHRGVDPGGWEVFTHWNM